MLPQGRLSEYQRDNALEEAPSLLEYVGHLLGCGNLLAGPLVSMREYLDFSHRRQARQGGAVGSRFGCVAYWAAAPRHHGGLRVPRYATARSPLPLQGRVGAAAAGAMACAGGSPAAVLPLLLPLLAAGRQIQARQNLEGGRRVPAARLFCQARACSLCTRCRPRTLDLDLHFTTVALP